MDLLHFVILRQILAFYLKYGGSSSRHLCLLRFKISRKEPGVLEIDSYYPIGSDWDYVPSTEQSQSPEDI